MPGLKKLPLQSLYSTSQVLDNFFYTFHIKVLSQHKRRTTVEISLWALLCFYSFDDFYMSGLASLVF